MIWKGTYTAIMALFAWLAIFLIVTGVLDYFFDYGWANDTTFMAGWYILFAIIPFRMAVWVINLVMTAFGMPLIYDIRYDQA